MDVNGQSLVKRLMGILKEEKERLSTIEAEKRSGAER